MSGAGSDLGFGPVVFFGLIGVGLITHSPADATYLNPADIMDIPAITAPINSVKVATPFADFPPARRPRLEVAVLDLPLVPAAAPAERQPAQDTGIGPLQVVVALPETGGQLTDPALFSALPAVSKALDPSPLRSGAKMRTPARATLDRPANSPDPLIEPVVSAYVTYTMIGPQAPATRQPRATAFAPPAPKALPASLEAPKRATPPKVIAAPNWQRVTGDYVNLRTAPDLSAPSLTQFNTGTRALAVARLGNWVRVNILSADPPITGWMSGDFLTPDPN